MFVLSGMMLAQQCSLIPFYKMLSTIGLYNTRIGMLITYIAYRVPFSFFLMWSFMLNLPVEVEEAAIIDGCSIRQVFFNIVLKMSKPVIATTAVMSARYIWNCAAGNFCHSFNQSDSVGRSDRRSDVSSTANGSCIYLSATVLCRWYEFRCCQRIKQEK